MELARRLAAGAVLACAVLQATALADRTEGEPRNGDIRRYVLGEVYDQHRVEQRFLVRADGLSSVTVHPRPASPSPTGVVNLALRDITRASDGPVVQRASAPLPDLARSDAFTMAFAPQASRNRMYALEITVQGGSDGQGIGLLASRGEGYPRATLLLNGRQWWGQLVFETTVDGATSNFGAIAEQLGGSGIPAPRAVLLLVLLVLNATVFLLIQAFSRWPDPAATAALPGRTRPSLSATR